MRDKGIPVINSDDGMTKTPTKKLVIAIVELYKSEDKIKKILAGELASSIIASYNDTEILTKDILGAYVSNKVMLEGMKLNMKRQFPEEAKLLSEIFGIFLFGVPL